MRAMVLHETGRLTESWQPLEAADLPVPPPGPEEILVRVAVCGVCHTELDEIEGRTPPPNLPVVLGHQVVGYVEQLGEHAAGFARGIVLELPGFTTRVAGVSNVLPATRICVRSSARRDEMWMVAMRST